jgi:peptidoglycan L-alanyl-D-glutamate endopeptidase CwlK
VIRGAAQTPQPFEVTYGLRTAAAEAALVAEGASQTLRSRHLASADGLARAVDVTPLIDGVLSFAPGREAEVYGQVAAQIQASADALGIPIQWGGAAVGAWTPGVVSHFRDWGHVQLPWAQYP